MRLLLFLFLCVQLLATTFDNVEPSSPEEIQSLQSNLLIDGYISASSGQISLSQIDLLVKGAQDLTLQRIYVPPQIQGRYHKEDKIDQVELCKALAQLQTKGWVVYPHLWAGYNQHSRHFQVRDPRGATLEFAIRGSQGELQTAHFGMSNLQGDSPSSSFDLRNISLVIDGTGTLVKITWPDGTTREYVKQNGLIWRLERELLPNGKAIRYEYGKEGLETVISCDRSGKHTYATIKKCGNEYIGSDGTKAHLFYEDKTISGSYKKKDHSEKASISFSVLTKSSHPSFQNTIGYNDRDLLTFYDDRKYPIHCEYDLKEKNLARVKKFSTPSGSITFAYDPAIPGKKKGATTVTYPDGAKLVYRFNEQLLLEAIENWDGENFINQKCYSYDHKQHVKSIETKDGKGHLLITKRFECDHAGNATLEVFEGDFGTFSIRREFDHNRLISELNDDGLQTRYVYLEDTHLPLVKEIWDNGQLLRKTTYAYDEAYNLIESQEVGKTKTQYTLYEAGPHLHRVKIEEQRDWDQNLIHKIEYFYDQWGNLSKENHFGSDDHFAYAINRIYNEKGELLSETNPLGEKACYQYDPRGYCIYEEPVSNGLVIRRNFDEKGRLISLKENEHETLFKYDASDELREKTDYLGSTTKYQYDPVHRKLTFIEDFSGITSISYDAFGRESRRTDAIGAITTTFHDSYGNVKKILYPEGGEEFFEYYPNGLTKSQRDPDGLLTTYVYDPLRRLTEKKVADLTTTYKYDPYHLIQETDSAGFITFYEYDCSNHLIAEKREGRLTQYRYDSLGFLAEENRSGRTIKTTNDFLGRVTTKSIDGVLNTSWQYDSGGNTVKIQKGAAITTFTYDAHNRLISRIDPEGNQTSVEYKIGARSLIELTTDPIGTLIVKTYDPQGNLLKKEIGNALIEEFAYDPMHRLKKRDHLIFAYTPSGKKSLMQEAGQRTTTWTYTPANRLKSEKRPDGTLLSCTYDLQGRLTQKGSRDFFYDDLGRLVGGTHFKRTLDPFGNILREEWSSGLWIESEYDDWNRPLQRRLPDHSKIVYTYEGPLLKTIERIGGDGKSQYIHRFDEYDERGNAQKERGFFNSCSQYDKLGRRVNKESLYDTETIQYDPLGRVIQRNAVSYTYDDLSQMTSESGQFSAVYDTHYNLIQLDGNLVTVDALNQIKGLDYDLNGNLLHLGFVYDEFGQLIQAGGEKYVYDALGRRIQKGNIGFLYIGDEEIGSFENAACRELKVGEPNPIAIEINGVPFAPIIDIQGTIRKLIDPRSGEIVQENSCDAFGKGVSKVPYGYTGKRYDQETSLIYFGQRFYDPNLRRWLTPDPAGPVDHTNLYQYLYNNPYLYQDPRGDSIGGYLLGVGEIVLGGTIIIAGGTLTVFSGGTLSFGLAFELGTGMALIGDGVSRATYHAQDMKAPNIVWKNTEVYAPDRPLPLTSDGVHIPTTDAPHTQLGTKEGRKGKYPQAREFDEHGNPIRDIDFTDHDRPQNHPNPHQHEWFPNPTGGTRSRDPKGQPVTGWNYS